MLLSALFSRASWLTAAFLTMGLAATAQTAAPAPATPTARRPDVIVRTNGDEVPARVLIISSEVVRYLAQSDSARQATDTLTLARSEVFMVRFANGTKEVMHPAVDETAASAEGVPALAHLSLTQRYERGQQDASNYRPVPGVFWGALGAGLAGGVLGGAGAGAAIAFSPPSRQNLVRQVPDPALLEDQSYYLGFQKQAQRRKVGKAMGGAAAGVGLQVVLYVALWAAVLAGGY